ncbi:hypothetical protein BCS42_02795 [Crenothrix sp. D3]|nr:hypothetical protein BCS42_02795 [Crenothrix sp. D3]
MASITEGNLSFIFEFDAVKFDDTSYYREYFSRIQNDIAAVDIVAVNNGIGYLIEIKDYTHPDTENLSSNDLIEAIIKKVISTLSAILPMKNSATDPAEKKIAKDFAKSSEIRIVLHIEKPPPRRTLKQSCYDFQNIETSLKRKLKPIDAHPKVVSKENLSGLPWVVI